MFFLSEANTPDEKMVKTIKITHKTTYMLENTYRLTPEILTVVFFSGW